MKNDSREKYANWFQQLRNQICESFEQLESIYDGPLKHQEPGKFSRQSWERNGGGGGVMSVMRGRLFEKVGVNFSEVWGEFSEEFRGKIPGTKESPKFYACGISLVAHMQSPLVPAIHMNTRFIETSESWVGGGMDLNPMIKNDEHKDYFHGELKKMCNRHNSEYYNRFSKWCDEYFFIKHRNETRGVGGIFYDNLNTGSQEADFEFTKDVGITFNRVFCDIVKTTMNNSWTEEEREIQLFRRGRYTEFNLIYDRGIQFGLATNGNPDAMFMSLPPVAKWP